jgi:signal transduction histidine kinase
MVPTTALSAEDSVEVLLRTAVHELRQPLSTIDAVAYYLKLILAREDVKAREQVAKLHELVEQANWILSSALQLSKASAVVPQSLDLAELISELASPARAGDWPIQLRTGSSPVLVHLDPGQARRLLESLCGLFRVLASEKHPAIVTIDKCAGSVALQLSTTIQGYRSEAALPAGSGLSLAVARRIVETHRGSLEVRIDPETGVCVRLVLT